MYRFVRSILSSNNSSRTDSSISRTNQLKFGDFSAPLVSPRQKLVAKVSTESSVCVAPSSLSHTVLVQLKDGCKWAEGYEKGTEGDRRERIIRKGVV